MSARPGVSVIVPARNAGATLPATLDSILSQDYPGPVELIVADGSDGPATAALLRARYPGVRRVDNPDRGISAGLNRALAAARHSVIARCDAHSTLPPDYLARAVGILQRTGAATVGGIQHAVGTTFFQRAVALTMASRLGSGGARYRVGATEGPADTVFLGVFRRDALAAVGGWDETLLRNEDYELNWRLREAGGIVWFAPELAASYRPRASFAALARQYYDYGRWKRAVLRRHPRSLRARQLAAPLLLLALAASALLAAAGGLLAAGWPGAEAAGHGFFILAALVPGAWAAALLGASAVAGLGRRDPAAVLMPAVFATIHLAWAAGFLVGARPASPDRCAMRTATGAGRVRADSEKEWA